MRDDCADEGSIFFELLHLVTYEVLGTESMLSVLLSRYLVALDAHTLHQYIFRAVVTDHLVESHTLEIMTKLVSDVHLTLSIFNVSSLFECSPRS
jgi:hypothetical protein